MLDKGIVRADQLRGFLTDVAEPHGLAPVPAAASPPPPGDATAPPPSPAPEGTGSATAVPVPESSGPPAGGGVARPVPVGGAELRPERQRQQQPLEAIAARSKIRTAYLQAIEEERVSDPPPA